MHLHNTWEDLPESEPYILDVDRQVIKDHKNYVGLRLDTLPEPLVGGLNNAKIIFLALNPGFTDDDVQVNMQLPGFITGCRANLKDPLNSEFYYFAGGLEKTGGFRWWTAKLKPLLNAGVSMDVLKERIMMIEYFPYHS